MHTLHAVRGTVERVAGVYRSLMLLSFRPFHEVPDQSVVKLELFALAHGVALGGGLLLALAAVGH